VWRECHRDVFIDIKLHDIQLREPCSKCGNAFRSAIRGRYPASSIEKESCVVANAGTNLENRTPGKLQMQGRQMLLAAPVVPLVRLDAKRFQGHFGLRSSHLVQKSAGKLFNEINSPP
jgi:hypothetical protein